MLRRTRHRSTTLLALWNVFIQRYKLRLCTIPLLERKLVGKNSRIRLHYVPELNTSFEFSSECILLNMIEPRFRYVALNLKSRKTETVYNLPSFRVPVKVGNSNGPLLNLRVHFQSERSAVAYFHSRFSIVAAGENKTCEIKYDIRRSRETLCADFNRYVEKYVSKFESAAVWCKFSHFHKYAKRATQQCQIFTTYFRAVNFCSVARKQTEKKERGANGIFREFFSFFRHYCSRVNVCE